MELLTDSLTEQEIAFLLDILHMDGITFKLAAVRLAASVEDKLQEMHRVAVAGKTA